MAIPPLEGLKVVTAHEMARVESLAYADGASETTFMENAGSAIADNILRFINERNLPKVAFLLAGKGNNGGDAFAAGIKLLDMGIAATALSLYPPEHCSPLCKKMQEKFRARGGSVHCDAPFEFGKSGVIVDGLVGTGFQGKAEGLLAKAIDAANQSGLPTIAIDIPSGLNGTTGEVGSVAIRAQETIFLGLPKLGFFIKDGWDYVGNLRYASFGLGEKYIAQAKASAFLFNEECVRHFLPPIKRTRHKYQAGYVLSIAGSPGFPGAALLASFSALRAGAGIVRLLHPEGMEAELSGAPYELIRESWDGKNFSRLKEEAPRAKTLLMGPGIGRAKKTGAMLQKVLKEIHLPAVVDADALYFLSQSSSWKLFKGSVLTPHRGEMQQLLSQFKIKNKAGKDELEIFQAFTQEKSLTLVLKGAPTFLFHPNTAPLIFTHGDPGMATAGTGDVLTGIIAAMIAQGLDARTAAALSVYLHGCAGEAAAQALTSYCMTASDLIDYLPEIFKKIICS